MIKESSRQSRWPRLLGIFVLYGLALALLAPIAATVLGAFLNGEWYGQRSEGAAAASTGALFAYVWTIWGRALITSGLIAATVTPLALLIGAPAAYAFRRKPFPGSEALEAAAVSVLSVPGIALAVALIVSAGGLGRFPLLVAGHLVYTIPLVLKTVGSALETIDPELEDAARSLGAGFGTRVWRVLLPLLGPSLVLSALMVFTVSWGEFNVSYLLATPVVQTFPAALYSTYTANSFPVAAAATALFLLPAVPVLALIQALGGSEFARGFQA